MDSGAIFQCVWDLTRTKTSMLMLLRLCIRDELGGGWRVLMLASFVFQEHLPFCALVQLFNPLLSPRCYAVVGLKRRDDRTWSR